MEFEETARHKNVFSRITATRKECPQLESLGIIDVGITHVGPGWCFIRIRPSFALVLVTITGRGRVICDDRWVDIGTENAYIMPPGVVTGYQAAVGESEWRYVWACFKSTEKFQALFSSGKPRTTGAASYSLHSAVRGLIGETDRSKDPQLMGLWSELLQASLNHLIRPSSIDPRLANLWAHVNEHLADPWDIKRMARYANLSREHLRRVSQRDLGCSPGRRLTALRLRRSCDFLLLTDGKLSSIASNVGFSDQFSYSQAFKREFGISPSIYRRKAVKNAETSGTA